MAVNLSPVQLRSDALLEIVPRILRDTNMQPSDLSLEITESAVLEEEQASIQTLLAIKAREVRIAMDDFGTGYSSLSYLKRYPIDTVKIDRSFVDGIPDDPSDAVLTQAIISLARVLDLRVVAEGVETGVLVETGSALSLVARSNDPAPDGNGVLFSFSMGPIPLNSTGSVAFTSALFGTSGGISDTPRIFTTDGQTLRQVVSRGQPALDANGTFGGFDSIGIEDNGDVSFWAFFENTSGGFTVDDRGVYRGDGVTDTQPAPLGEVIRSGELLPGGVETVGNIDQNLASHRDGWVAVRTFLNNTPNPGIDNLAVFVDEGVVRLRRFTIGDESPDGNGDIFSFPIPFIGRDGNVATSVTFNNSNAGLMDNMGVVAFDSASALGDTVLIRENDDPGGDGPFTGQFTGALGFASTMVAPNRLVFYGTRKQRLEPRRGRPLHYGAVALAEIGAEPPPECSGIGFPPLPARGPAVTYNRLSGCGRS